MKAPLVLLAAGTRGDVQPYLALAARMRQAGLPARLVAPAAYAQEAAALSVPFAPLAANPSDLMARPGGQSTLTYDGSLLRSLRASLAYVRAARPVYARMLASAWQNCQGAGGLLIGLPTLWGEGIAEALDVPCYWGFLQPFLPTAAFACPLLPANLRLPAGWNRRSYGLVEWMTWRPWQAVLNGWRGRTLRLSPRAAADPYPRLHRPGARVLHAFSPQLVPPPPDWPARQVTTGAWAVTGVGAGLPESLRAFLESGAPPVFIGFGSPGTFDPRSEAALTIEALRLAGLRGLLQLPEACFPEPFDRRAIFPLGIVDHAALFPYLAAVVHHGGAGTTHTALRAGIPQVVTPLAADQYFWAGRLWQLTISPAPLPRYKLTALALAEALTDALRPERAARARQVGEQAQRENGLETALAFIRQML